MNTLTHLIILLTFLTLSNSEDNLDMDLNYKTHTFYYNWYGNPETDGKYFHWDHEILPHWSNPKWNDAGKFSGKDDIGANYYPELGTYSSNDPEIIKKHLEMIVQAGIGVVVISWWGKDSFEDRSITTYLNLAKEYQLKVAFHIEPFYKTIEDLKIQLEYLITKYGTHPAFYKLDDKPFFYLYDSYKLEISKWQKLLTKNGDQTIRGSSLDGVFIGLWVEEDHGNFIKQSGFDGAYTYFASDGFVYGSSSQNWRSMANFALENQLLFIPCVAPGYIDTRIRPWNSLNRKDREGGNYYRKMFDAALSLSPNFIGITSFNEWHEGTQIEPSIPKKYNDYRYEDFSETGDSWFYIKLTRKLLSRFE